MIQSLSGQLHSVFRRLEILKDYCLVWYLHFITPSLITLYDDICAKSMNEIKN